MVNCPTKKIIGVMYPQYREEQNANRQIGNGQNDINLHYSEMWKIMDV